MIKYLKSIYGILIVVCIIAAIVIYSCFSERGLLKVFSLKAELREIEEFNESIQLENEAMNESIPLLNDDLRHIEKLAREELGLLEAGEFVYFFENE